MPTANPRPAIQQPQELEISEENVRQLMDMGFDENKCREALRRCYNDLNAAANSLLAGYTCLFYTKLLIILRIHLSFN